jgi:RNase P subunit RPR2
MQMTTLNEIKSHTFRHCGHLMMLVSVPVAGSWSRTAQQIGFSCLCCGKIIQVARRSEKATWQ